MIPSSKSMLNAGARLSVDDSPSSNEHPRAPASADVIVIGAGVIGLSIAWRLAQRGLAVVVFERGRAGDGATGAATGMLAAAAELEPGGSDLLAFARQSQELWPAFRTSLENAAGTSIDLRTEGTLLVAIGREEIERLRFRHDLHRRSGVRTDWLTGPEIRQRERGLRPSITAGIFCPDDHQVDPRRLVVALREALLRDGGRLIEHCPVDALDYSGGKVTSVSTPAGPCRAQNVVIATGAWTHGSNLLPQGSGTFPVRPLKGQALALRMTQATGMLRHVVWTDQVHLAPKSDGRLIVGATVEERGFDPTVTAGGVLALLDGARRALPSIEEMELEAIFTGFRPTSIDDAPILGSLGVDGLVVATGHHRNGILLAPVTADAITTLLLDGTLPDMAAWFGRDRFLTPSEHTR